MPDRVNDYDDDGPSFAAQRQLMVERHLAGRGIADEKVLEALGRVPREAFLPAALHEFAYHDTPLPVAEGQTITQPFIVALMVEALQLEGGERVLEIGTGTGYAAAVLAEIAGEVVSIERHAALADAAREVLGRTGYGFVHVVHGDGTRGWPQRAPYDAIVVAAGGPAVPASLRDQLAIGGRLVIPVGPAHDQVLVRIVRAAEDVFDEERLERVRFVPLVGEEGWPDRETALASGPPVPHLLAPGPPPSDTSATTVELLASAAEPIGDLEEVSLEPLLHRIGDARIVLIGDATHGTSEFYRFRARITRELIVRRAFDVVAIEADWPDAARIDRHVRGGVAQASGWTAFSRFPSWMWRNEEVLAFVQWLREHNAALEAGDRTGCYGLDLYSLSTSIDAVLPSAGHDDAWSERVDHMAETLESVLGHRGPDSKAIVWAHNAHVGDASATDMAVRAQASLGQRCRRAYGRDAYLIGMGTHTGTVAAAREWGGPMQIERVRPSLVGSWERLAHDTGLPAFLLGLRDPGPDPLREALRRTRLQRAIGAVYRPETEREDHYFESRLGEQYDEYVYFDETEAVLPLTTTELQDMRDPHPLGVQTD